MGRQQKVFSGLYKKALSTRSKKLVVIGVVVLAIFHETFPWTTQRGWSYAKMIVDGLSWLFNTNIPLDKVYEWEARILAITADVAFIVLIIVLALWFYEVFIKKEKDKGAKDTSEEVKAIQKLNRDIKREFKKLRIEIKTDENKGDK